jgi:hypothetical protein
MMTLSGISSPFKGNPPIGLILGEKKKIKPLDLI